MSAPGSSPAATPLADVVLVNPLAIPSGVAEWLRRWEGQLRELRERLAQVHAGQDWLTTIAEALAEVDLILGNDRLSAFRMLLKRPLGQLVDGTPARVGFDRLAKGIVDRGESALVVARLAAAARVRLAIVESAFGTGLPGRFADLVRRHRIGYDDLARLRRPQEAELAMRRILTVERTLSDLAAVVGFAQLPIERVPHEPLTPLELRLALELRQRQRNSHRQIEGTAPRERALLGAHLDQLTRLSKQAVSHEGPLHPTIAMLEGTLSRARLISESVPYGWPDGPLWVGAIAAANARRFGTPGRFAWSPIIAQPPASQGLPDRTAGVVPLRVLPLGNGLAYISRKVDSAIRLWSAETTLGSEVEAQVAADDLIRIQPGLLADDLTDLFDGFDTRQTRWYENRRRAELYVIAKDDQGYFARVRRRGELKTLEDPAWRPESAGTGFRVLLPTANLHRGNGDFAESDDVIEVARIGQTPPATFLGFASVEVRTGLLDNERAWFRATTHQWQGASVAIKRESELFGLIATRAPSVDALRRLATARLPNSRRKGPLYRVPSGFFFPDTRAFGRQLTGHVRALLATVRAVARVIRGVHQCGYALGSCHLDAFAYCVDWSEFVLVPDPAVVLAHAPCATPLGETYTPPLTPAGQDSVRFSMLGAPVLTPMVQAQERARPEDDMLCFGGFIVDLLMRERLADPATWFEVIGGAWSRVQSVAFADQELARAVLEASRDDAGRAKMLAMCDAIIQSTPTDSSSLVALLE